MIKSISGTGTNRDDARQCVLEATKDLVDPKLIIFFSDDKYFREYAALLHELYPKAVSIGCTAYRIWGASGAKKDILEVMSAEDGIICSGGVIEKADNFALSYADNIRRCVQEVNETENTVCIEFTAPAKNSEEYALMALNSVLLRKGIEVVGGSAGNTVIDGQTATECLVALNGKVYKDGCVFVLIHSLSGKIYMLRENIYEPLTGNELLVTKANSEKRTVMTYNGKTAADVYADELGIPKEDIGKYFFNFPMGRKAADDIFMTAICGAGANGSMKHLARVHEGTRMIVMKEGDYKRITCETIETVKKRSGKPSMVIAFQCTARTIFFETKNYLEEYADKLSEVFPDYIGFSCNGEQHGTKHFNHTLMLVVFE